MHGSVDDGRHRASVPSEHTDDEGNIMSITDIRLDASREDDIAHDGTHAGERSADRGGADADAVDAFADRVLGAVLGAAETMSIHLGTQLGWYDALADGSGHTAAELAESTGTDARYAREWLEQQAAYGILVADEPSELPEERRFTLPAHAVPVLADPSSLAFTAPLARMFAAAGHRMPELVEAYRTGGGVSWEDFGVHARESQAEANKPWFEAMPATLADTPRLHDLLSHPGARVADVGMGLGWSSLALAQAYPNLRVEGVDVDTASVELARRHAAQAGVSDRVVFHEQDAAQLDAIGTFDAIFAFECLHDMPHPVEVLSAMRRAVRPGGAVVIMDEAVADDFAPDAGPADRLMYGFSLFICLPDGRSHPHSAATGTVMRPDTLRRYAREAGWNDVRVIVPEFGFWRFYELL